MKTTTKFALTTLAAAVLSTGSMFANDWYTIDNHHGLVIYLPATKKTQTTIGVFENGRGVGTRETTTRRTEVRAQNDTRLRHVTTSQGTVSYFAPAE